MQSAFSVFWSQLFLRWTHFLCRHTYFFNWKMCTSHRLAGDAHKRIGCNIVDSTFFMCPTKSLTFESKLQFCRLLPSLSCVTLVPTRSISLMWTMHALAADPFHMLPIIQQNQSVAQHSRRFDRPIKTNYHLNYSPTFVGTKRAVYNEMPSISIRIWVI